MDDNSTQDIYTYVYIIYIKKVFKQITIIAKNKLIAT